jgi:PAS domain S-box-containing protein
MREPSPLTSMLLHQKTGAWVALLQEDGAVLDTRNGPSDLTKGQNLLDNVRHDHRQLIAAAVQDAISPGIPHRIDIETESPHGRRVYDCTMSKMNNKVLMVGLEVTQRRREEEHLRHTERLMRDTEGISHLGTWYWDVSEPHAHWSPELYRIYGLDPDTHTPTYQDYLTRVHPDDVERVKKATEAVFNHKRPYGHDERIRRSDGTWRVLHTWGRPIMDDDGNLVALLGVCQDITDRKHAEQELKKSEMRYRAIFDMAGDGLAVIDKQGKIKSANRTLQNTCGLPEAQMEHLDFTNLIHADDISKFQAALQATESGPVSGRLRLVSWDADLTLAPLAEDEVLVFLEWDNDDKKREGIIRRLEEESQWKTRILQVASHELKNPLTPILLNLHTLKARGTLGKKEEELLERTSDQVKRLSRMVHEFLDTARLQQGTMVISEREWDLDELVDSVTADLAEEAATNNVTLRRTGSTGTAKGDRDLIRQVLVNLLQNAIRHTPRGSEITIGLEDGPRVTIIDAGSGIAKTDVETLFRPFGTLGPHHPSSTGLGLYVCKVILEAHKGKIGVEPGPPGKFWFTWPGAPSPADKDTEDH